MISKALNSVQLWAVCLAGTIVFSLWGGGTFGGNLSTQTLHDFSVIGLVFAAVGALAAFRSSMPGRLFLGWGATLGLGFWGGSAPSALHADTAFFVLAIAQGVAGALALALSLEDDLDRVKEQRTAYLMVAVAVFGTPLIWGHADMAKILLPITIAAGVIAYLRSHKFLGPTTVYFSIVGGAAAWAFSYLHGDVIPALASLLAFSSVMMFTHISQINAESKRRRGAAGYPAAR